MNKGTQKNKLYEELKSLLDLIPIREKEKRKKLKRFMRFIDSKL